MDSAPRSHPAVPGLAVPDGWRVQDAEGPPLFITRARVSGPDGVEVDWTSRRHRKGRAPASVAEAAPRRRGLTARASASSWWMGALFAVGAWGIAMLNLTGSVAFGLAAIGARYLVTTGEPANIALVNAGTFVGAVCFFAGAALLPLESAADRSRE